MESTHEGICSLQLRTCVGSKQGVQIFQIFQINMSAGQIWYITKSKKVKAEQKYKNLGTCNMTYQARLGLRTKGMRRRANLPR